jgi:hypothetical protein
MVAGISALLAVPRAVPPSEMPEPLIAPRALEQVARDDLALVAAAEREGLDADVRLLGEAVRAYGRAEAADDTDAVVRERARVVEAFQLASAQGETALARLRACQLRSFLRELRRWEQTGEASDELRELGGRFLDGARQEGWIDGRHLLLDEAVRAAQFKLRWMAITTAHGPSLALAPVERLALDRFLLLYPHRDRSWSDPRQGAPLMHAADDEKKYQLRKIDEISALDPSYPADLAKGVVYFRHRSYALAAKSFTTHLEDHPSGPYNVRAQNYLLAALALAGP